MVAWKKYTFDVVLIRNFNSKYIHEIGNWEIKIRENNATAAIGIEPLILNL